MLATQLPRRTLSSIDELVQHEDSRGTMATAIVRIERQDMDSRRVVPVPRPGRIYDERPDLTVALDHYFFDIEMGLNGHSRSYTLRDEMLLVAVYAAWPSGIGSYRFKDGKLWQEPLDLELKPVSQEVANFLMLAQLHARAEELRRVTGRRPNLLVQREHCSPIVVPSSAIERTAAAEERLGYRGHRATEYYTCPKPRLERFFTASSSGPRP